MNFYLALVLACVFLAVAVNGGIWLARRRHRNRAGHAPARFCARARPGKPVDGRPLDDYENQKLRDIAGAFSDDKEAAR